MTFTWNFITESSLHDAVRWSWMEWYSRGSGDTKTSCFTFPISFNGAFKTWAAVFLSLKRKSADLISYVGLVGSTSLVFELTKWENFGTYEVFKFAIFSLFLVTAREVQNSEEACTNQNFNSQTLPYVTLISKYVDEVDDEVMELLISFAYLFTVAGFCEGSYLFTPLMVSVDKVSLE